MDNLVVGIHQPNFMPWLGYFYKIMQSDVFIFLDDVQFQKTGASYTNRVSLNINGENKFFTIPIKRPSGVWMVNETQPINNKWKKKLIGTLQANYAKAEFFSENKEFIFNLINQDFDNLATYNMNFIVAISERLEFKTVFKKSSNFNLTSVSTERLVELILAVNGEVYLSGSGGDNYQDKGMYSNANIKLAYNRMSNYEYKQVATDSFIGGLSIVDAIFNKGFENLKLEFFKFKEELRYD